MSINVKSMFSAHDLYSRKILAIISLLFVVSLLSSPLVSVFNEFSPFASGALDKIVNNETELRNAINNAQNNKSTVIALGNDITLTESTLTIPAGKDITLTSNKTNGHYKLTSTATKVSPVMVGDVSISISTITVNGNGVLKLDGVIVTHDWYGGSLIMVSENGHLIMYKGLISSNINGVSNNGVSNRGTFEMYDGEISGNSAVTGGGVFNWGVFRMFGGTITGNTATDGGGVINMWDGVFEMSGGIISDNSVGRDGGGVYNAGGTAWAEYRYSGIDTKELIGYNQRGGGSFTMSGGEISGNLGAWGGGVSNMGMFVMKDSVIVNNTALHGGGGVNNGGSGVQANFEMMDSEISGNRVDKGEIVDDVPEKGGGIYNSFDCIVNLSGTSVISDNTATNLGGGVCNDGNFTMVEGTISGNSASRGGGMYIGFGEVRLLGGKVLGNTAKMGNNVYDENGNLVLSDGVSTDKIILKYRDIYVLIVIAIVISCVIVGGWFISKKRKT